MGGKVIFFGIFLITLLFLLKVQNLLWNQNFSVGKNEVQYRCEEATKSPYHTLQRIRNSRVELEPFPHSDTTEVCGITNPSKLGLHTDFHFNNSFERVLNNFHSLGYFHDEHLALPSSEVDAYALKFKSILNSNPEAIIYNKRQKGRLKFRFNPRKNKNKFSESLLLDLKKMLNQQIWLCQSILLGKQAAFLNTKMYWLDKRFTYVASGNHVIGPSSFEQFPHHDVSLHGFPRVCGIGFYLQDVLSISNGPIEIWPATQHLLHSYATRKLRETRSANEKETGYSGKHNEFKRIISFYNDFSSKMPSQVFLAHRGTVMLRDFRTLHRGRMVCTKNYNRTMVELFVAKTDSNR